MDSSLWEDSISGSIKYEKNLSFTAVPTSEDDEYGYSKKKLPRDPLSHRIIEKRRRDRMNNCLSDLSRLIPSEYMKKGRGRVEKTEIIEMAIRHMKHLQSNPCTVGGIKHDEDRLPQKLNHCTTNESQQQVESTVTAADQYRLGFNECLSETMHFLVEVEGFFSSDSLCLQLTSHLHNHCDNILKGKAFMAQLSAAAQSKRRLADMEDITDIKQSVDCDAYTNGYHAESHNNHTQEPNGGGGAVAPYQNHSVYPDSSSATVPYSPYQQLPRSMSFTQQLSPTLSCQGSDRGMDSMGSYKFKEDIRKRFCREAGDVQSPSANSSSSLTRRIPVFALSPRGSYYVPLTLDLPSLEEGDTREATVLHPVTISVSFPSPPQSRMLQHTFRQDSEGHDTGQ